MKIKRFTIAYIVYVLVIYIAFAYVSLKMNPVLRYDAVDKESIPAQMFVCDYCDICELIDNFPCNRIIGGDRVFKKSNKSFEDEIPTSK